MERLLESSWRKSRQQTNNIQQDDQPQVQNCNGKLTKAEKNQKVLDSGCIENL